MCVCVADAFFFLHFKLQGLEDGRCIFTRISSYKTLCTIAIECKCLARLESYSVWAHFVGEREKIFSSNTITRRESEYQLYKLSIHQAIYWRGRWADVVWVLSVKYFVQHFHHFTQAWHAIFHISFWMAKGNECDMASHFYFLTCVFTTFALVLVDAPR